MIMYEIGGHKQMIEEFKKIIASSDNIVFFGGAGYPPESGIPDFRSVDGRIQSEIRLSAGNNFKPYVFYGAYGGIL